MTTATTTGFVPDDLQPGEWGQLEPLYQALLSRPLDTLEHLEHWLADYSQLTAAVSEYGSRTYIDKACHTEDADIEKRFLHWIEQIQPRLKPLGFALQKKYLAGAARQARSTAARKRYEVLDREWAMEVEIFREANVPLQTQEQKLIAEFDKVQGATIVAFEDKEYTPQQMGRFLEETDRPRREAAWRAVEERRGRDTGKLDELFDGLLDLRAKIAANAGCADFRAYLWKSMFRFDYTPEDCARFAGAIEAACVPVAQEMDRARAADLKLEKLRPWDGAVDPRGRAPLRPFAQDQIEEFVGQCAVIFDRVAPKLGSQFRRLKMGRNLDLESRRGKRPGGFQSNLEKSRQTFIFMNAAGLQGDVDTMLHEAGHAFHSMAYYDAVPLVFQRSPGMEFCEVASMSMELLAGAHLEVFYAGSTTPDGAMRARRTHLEHVVRILPWIAVIDQFQHWLYTHAGHTQQERAEAWLKIYGRFFSSPWVDWSGLESARRHRWQRQLHLYHVPFYYVEYGIAQLGALQVWLNYRRDPRSTLEALLHAFSLGNTRPLPELFAAAGIRFDFSAETLRPLMAAVAEEMAKLPG